MPAWWTISTFHDPLERRIARLVQALLTGTALCAAGALLLLGPRIAEPAIRFPAAINGAISLPALVALVMLRRGYLRTAVGIAAGRLLVTFSAALLSIGLPLTLTGLLLDRRALWLMVIGCIGVVLGIAVAEQRAVAWVGFTAPPPPVVTVSAFGICVVLLGLLIDRVSAATCVAVRDVQQMNQQLGEALQARERLEAQLVQSQRLASLGRLAGGIAHDFNNLLTVILAYAQLDQQLVLHDHAVQPDLREIEAAAKRASELTRQILAFARQQVIAPQSVDLNDLLDGLETLLSRLIGEHITL